MKCHFLFFPHQNEEQLRGKRVDDNSSQGFVVGLLFYHLCFSFLGSCKTFKTHPCQVAATEVVSNTDP